MDLNPAFSIDPPRARKLRFQRLRVLFALIVREMGSRFGRSAGGYLWAIAEPLGGIVMLAVVFGLALRSPPLGDSFMLFYASGMMPFYMFNTMSRGVSSAVNSNKGLLTYPVVTVLDAVLAKFLLNFLTVGIIATLLISGIILTLDVPVNLNFAAILGGFGMAALLGLGVGALNCVLFGFFPTWKNIWTVLTRPLLILSGVLYLFESVPPAFQHLLWYNPIVHVVALTRSGFFGSYHPYFVSPGYVLAIALTSFVIGAYLMRRHTSFLLEQ